MRILVIGSGGREHALAWKIAQSPSVDEVLVAPGNGGTASGKVRNVPADVSDLMGLIVLARKEKIDLVVPGPELPLTNGISDAMFAAGIACFGPDRHCAKLEGSKRFAKELMIKTGVPTAACAVFDNIFAAKKLVEERNSPLVVKADGLAAGKGVVVAKDKEEALAALDEIMKDRAFGAAGDTVVIEEKLEGEEVSLLCFCDGEHVVPLASAQDHKAAYDGDTGPNTGGMGAYSPAPILPDDQLEAMADVTIRPVVKQLAKDGHPFVGVLYAGLMITKKGPKVLEYNVRFGDPECQPLMKRLDSDLVDIMFACVQGRLDKSMVSFRKESALGVVVSAKGYPGSYKKGMPIDGIDKAEEDEGVTVFHSGTKLEGGKVLSNGGRVLCVTALGQGLAEAQKAAYEAVAKISMPDSAFRTDIGQKGIRRLTQGA